MPSDKGRQADRMTWPIQLPLTSSPPFFPAAAWQLAAPRKKNHKLGYLNHQDIVWTNSRAKGFARGR